MSAAALLALALDYAEAGWPVFPCKPDKKPYTEHGLLDATKDPEQIRKWWNRWPRANIGGATGSASGRVALDVDVKNGAPGLDSLQALVDELGEAILDTAVVQTPSGGLHHIYRQNGEVIRNSAGKLGPGLDVRGDGGYILLPGSRTAEGEYKHLNAHRPAPLPDALAKKMTAATAKTSTPLADGTAIPVGQRNATLTSLGGSMRRRGFGEAAIRAALLEENKRCDGGGLPEADVRTIAASVTRYAPAGASETAGWPTPLGEAAYHGPLGGLVKVWAPECEADPAALLLTLLSGWGSVCGPGPYHLVNADRHTARLFVCVVGDSANARKGMSYGPPADALARVDPKWAENCLADGLSTGEGLIYRVRDPKWERDKHGNDIPEDVGVSDKRLWVKAAEFARVTTVMARESNTLSPVIRELYDTGRASVMTKGHHDKATGAHVSVIAHITQAELARSLTECDSLNGFANRFLWPCAKRAGSLPFGGNPAKAEAEPFIHTLQVAGGRIGAGEFDGPVPWSEDARQLWADRYEGLFEPGSGLTASILARSHAQVLRLALCYALADASKVIGRDHLEAALEVWRYCHDSVRYIFGDHTGDLTADRIHEALKRGGLNRTEINDLFGGHKLKPELDAALETLRSAGLAHSERLDDGNRHAELWLEGPAIEGGSDDV